MLTVEPILVTTTSWYFEIIFPFKTDAQTEQNKQQQENKGTDLSPHLLKEDRVKGLYIN